MVSIIARRGYLYDMLLRIVRIEIVKLIDKVSHQILKVHSTFLRELKSYGILSTRESRSSVNSRKVAEKTIN